MVQEVEFPALIQVNGDPHQLQCGKGDICGWAALISHPVGPADLEPPKELGWGDRTEHHIFP